MRRRPLLWLGILLTLGLVLTVAFPTSLYVLLGLLQREAFYDGKPTGYWVSALTKRGYFGSAGRPRDVPKLLLDAGAAAVPVLADMLGEEDEDVRVQALLALSAMKPGEAAAAVSALERVLRNQGPGFPRELAVGALIKADKAAALHTFLGMLQRGESTENRLLAARTLGSFGPRARAAVEALRSSLDDQERKLRVAAAGALWRIERRVDTKLVLTLAQDEGADCDDSPFSRQPWKDLAPEAQAVLPDLLQALQNPEEAIRLCAAVALGRLAQRHLTKEAVRGLTAKLNDDSKMVRKAAACALAKMGPKAADAVPALIEALHDRDREVRLAVARSLGNIGPAACAAVPHLGRLLKDPGRSERMIAAYALGQMGPAAKAAVPDLIEALQDKDEYTRSSAAEVLGRIGPVTKTVIPGLIAALQDPSKDVRRSSAYALEAIGLAQAHVP